jgi:DNA-binding response OmpR family regulator
MIKIPTKVLVVDDEKDFVEMLSLRLKEMEEQVDAVYNGQDCLNKLEGNDIDVVILDIKMPGMDGIAESAVEGMKLGAFDYLLKPADIDSLTEKVNGARRRKEEHEERIRQAEVRLLLRKVGEV